MGCCYSFDQFSLLLIFFFCPKSVGISVLSQAIMLGLHSISVLCYTFLLMSFSTRKVSLLSLSSISSWLASNSFVAIATIYPVFLLSASFDVLSSDFTSKLYSLQFCTLRGQIDRKLHVNA